MQDIDVTLVVDKILNKYQFNMSVIIASAVTSTSDDNDDDL